MDLTISIATWNDRDYLRQCLKSIYNSTKEINFEVIAMDNASADDTAKMVSQEFPQVFLIRNSQNLGFAKAHNQAIKQARGKYTVILNQDTLILDNALGKMTSFLDNHPDVGALGCKIYTSLEKTKIQVSAFKRFPTPGLVLFHILVNGNLKKIFARSKLINRLFERYSFECDNHDLEQEVLHLVGAIIMVRREVIEDVGLLDEQFFMYFEETDWCLRMRQKGWKIYYTPEAGIVHFYKPSRSTTGIQEKIRQESYFKYLKKHHSLFLVGFYKIIYSLLPLKRIFSDYIKNEF